MKLKHKINVNLLEFFATGKFDYLKIGQTKEWIRNNFPDPDETCPKEWVRERDLDIWRYGDLELHFNGENLYMIFSDYWYENSFYAGEDINVKKWILKDTCKLTLLFVMKKLNRKNIDFNKVSSDLGIRLKLKSGVELCFENIHDEENLSPNQFLLAVFSLRE